MSKNIEFKKIELEKCESFPKDKVNIPSLIEDLNFIKIKRPFLYKELQELKDENGNLFNLEDNSKENVANVQKRYFSVKAYEYLYKRFETSEISEEAKPYYLERFEFELKIINDMNFDGYTLLVSDFLSTLNVKLGGLIGPGRGSAAGSLVSWAYGITNVDPMLDYLNTSSHLLFERYLNPERVSLPDIDMDMNGLINKTNLINQLESDEIDETTQTFLNIIKSKYENEENLEGKSLIEDYQVAIYGKDKVAKIVTRDTYQAKSAIAAVCRYLGNDFAEEAGFRYRGTPYIELASRISGIAFQKPGVGFKDIFDKDSKFYNPYFINMYDSNYHVRKVVDLAKKLEGSIANYGVHAAGVLILDPQNNYLNNGYMVIGGTNVSVFDGKHVEDYINIKFDFLGLASLEEIDKTLKFIEKRYGKEKRNQVFYTINNEKLLYEDKDIYKKIFDTQNTKKIFQFSSDGMQDLVKRVKPENFEELVAITALYRPGPMESGMVDMFVKNKNDASLIFYPFKELEGILEPTHGTCLSGETLITTKNGKNKTIKEIVDNNDIGLEVASINENTNKIEYKKISRTYNNGVKNIFQLSTKNGYSIKATSDHKFLTNLGWKELKDLNLNDFLVLQKRDLENKSKTLYNKDKLTILAYLLSDGHLAKSSISFINKDDELINTFKNSINNVFNNIKFVENVNFRNVKQVLCTTKNRTTYNSNELINWIKELGLFYKRSHEKFIPNFIFDLSKEDILFFLAKYWECDGSISKNGCHIKTISKDICFSLQKLLLKVGINSSLNIKPYENLKRDNQIAYGVNISPFNFKEISKYISSKKGKVQIDFKNDNVLAPIDSNFIIPYINNKLKEKNITRKTFVNSTGISASLFNPKSYRPITINLLKKINSLLNDKLIEGVINNDIYFTKIKEIVDLNEKVEVYDIEVEGNHNFFANNILVHNCVYQEQIMKIVQDLAGFSLGGADLVRRAMGKKIKEEMDKLKDQFINGVLNKYKNNHLSLNTLESFSKSQEFINYYDGKEIHFKSIKEMNELNTGEQFTDKDYGRLIIKKGEKLKISEDYITRLLANNLFENIVKFAGYGFNKSHAYAYTNVSMQMAYLKAHYPLEFFASIFVNNSNDIEKLTEYIVDSKKNGIMIYGVDINKSNLEFDIINNNAIIYGLSNIKGISNKDIKHILQERNLNGEYKSFCDFLNRFIKMNGSFKTLENLISVGAFDDLDFTQNLDQGKLLFDNSLNKISITENEEVYNLRLLNKTKYLNDLINNKFDVFDLVGMDNDLSSKYLKYFDIEDKKYLLPLLLTKILKTKDTTIAKIFNAKTNTSKIKLISEIEEIYDNMNELKSLIVIPNDLFKTEVKRAFFSKVGNLLEAHKLTEKNINDIEEDFVNKKSLIKSSNIEFEMTGSLSNMGSILIKNYVFKDYLDIPKLNLLSNPFEVEGNFLYKVVAKDIIKGENEKGELYLSLIVLDVNGIQTRFYFNNDQISRYKNNIESGDPLIIEVDIKEGKNDFYKKIVNIEVLKENDNWKKFDCLKPRPLSIKQLNQTKIKDNYPKVDFCELDRLMDDWRNSSSGWKGLDADSNRVVCFILVNYKLITTKDDRKYQIITISDGLNNQSLDLFYSNIGETDLKDNLNKPIIIEISKRSDNGYGISAGYKTNIIFLGDDYLKDEENKSKLEDSYLEILDGREHINVYSKGKTLLGRKLSNFADIPTEVEIDGELIRFKNVESLWFYLKIYLSLNEKDINLLDMEGYEAKEYGTKKTKLIPPLKEEQKAYFIEKIKEGLKWKILNNEALLEEFKANQGKIPYAHYYNYSGNIRTLPGAEWLVDFLNELRF